MKRIAKKKITVDEKIDEIKRLITEKRIIMGSDRTLKASKTGRLSKVFISRNCSDETRADIKAVSNAAGFEIVELEYSNTELGTICKKPFSISVLGVTKDEPDKA